MPRGSVSLMFTKIKETGRDRHRIPPRFFVSRATHDTSACEKHVPPVIHGECGSHATPRRFAPQGRIRPYSPEMTGGTHIYFPYIINFMKSSNDAKVKFILKNKQKRFAIQRLLCTKPSVKDLPGLLLLVVFSFFF